MELGTPVFFAHTRDGLIRFNIIAFRHQQGLIVGIGTQIIIVVFNNNDIAITD